MFTRRVSGHAHGATTRRTSPVRLGIPSLLEVSAQTRLASRAHRYTDGLMVPTDTDLAAVD